MDLHLIENMIAIEQEQSISKAAEKLYLTQSALNQQLLRLEKELGTQLFERRKHSMVPVSYTHLDVYKRQIQYASGSAVGSAKTLSQ